MRQISPLIFTRIAVLIRGTFKGRQWEVQKFHRGCFLRIAPILFRMFRHKVVKHI